MNRRPELDCLRVVAMRPAARVRSWLDHARRLSYPFHILHQTVIVVIGRAWMHAALGPSARFGAVLASWFAVTWVLCELLSRTPPLRPRFGLAPHRLVTPVLARVV